MGDSLSILASNQSLQVFHLKPWKWEWIFCFPVQDSLSCGTSQGDCVDIPWLGVVKAALGMKTIPNFPSGETSNSSLSPESALLMVLPGGAGGSVNTQMAVLFYQKHSLLLLSSHPLIPCVLQQSISH